MNAEFYLFDVDHGQSAALRLPNGRWCIFDLGCTASFSPVRWIAARNTLSSPLSQALLCQPAFRFFKATVSHLHGDHLGDWPNLTIYGSDFIRTVQPDQAYISDCRGSNTSQSFPAVYRFSEYVSQNFSGVYTPNYGGVSIGELSLPVEVARGIGGDANARVNNASIVTRIEANGITILLCGDMTKEAWEAIIADQGEYGLAWRPFLRNVDILVAPHHGHRSGYSTELLNLARPSVVLVSVVSKDSNVDTRYSHTPVRGIRIGSTDYSYISTRQKGHIKIVIAPPQLGTPYLGNTFWTFGAEALFDVLHI